MHAQWEFLKTIMNKVEHVLSSFLLVDWGMRYRATMLLLRSTWSVSCWRRRPPARAPRWPRLMSNAPLTWRSRNHVVMTTTVTWFRYGIQNFFFFGGGRKRLCGHTHHELEARVPYGRGKRALEALRVYDALSCYLSLIFKHSDTKWDTIKHSRSNGGGGHLLRSL